MTESIEELQAILDNAPDMKGIEHDGFYYCTEYGLEYYIYIIDGNVFVYDKGWREDKKCNYPLNEFWTISSLADIKRIVELMKELQK